MEAAGARHEATGADPVAELGLAAEEEVSGASEWEDWSMGDWIAGTGVNLGVAEAEAGAGAESEGEELLARAEDSASGSQWGAAAVEAAAVEEATAAESWWVVVDSSTVEGVGRAVELDVALQAFVATVEVDGAWGDGQLAMQLGDLGGQKG